MPDSAYWRRCSTCKAEIGFKQTYWICGISTCNRKNTGFVFCSMPCWSAHVPVMRHRPNAWAEENRSPSKEAWEQEQREQANAEKDSLMLEDEGGCFELNTSAEIPEDILVVVSKVKQYVRARSGMNTSEEVANILSDHIRSLCDEGILKAAEAGRKTLMDRDIRPKNIKVHY